MIERVSLSFEIVRDAVLKHEIYYEQVIPDCDLDISPTLIAHRRAKNEPDMVEIVYFHPWWHEQRAVSVLRIRRLDTITEVEIDLSNDALPSYDQEIHTCIIQSCKALLASLAQQQASQKVYSSEPPGQEAGWDARFDWFYGYGHSVSGYTLEKFAEAIDVSLPTLKRHKKAYDNKHGTSLKKSKGEANRETPLIQD